MGAGHQIVWGDWQAFCLSPCFWFRPHSFINIQMNCAPNLCRTVSFSCFLLYGLAFSYVFLFCLHHHNLYVFSHFFVPIPSAAFWMFLASLFHHQPAAALPSWTLVSSKPDRSQSWQTAGNQKKTPPAPKSAHSLLACVCVCVWRCFTSDVLNQTNTSPGCFSEQRSCNWGVSSGWTSLESRCLERKELPTPPSLPHPCSPAWTCLHSWRCWRSRTCFSYWCLLFPHDEPVLMALLSPAAHNGRLVNWPFD